MAASGYRSTAKRQRGEDPFCLVRHDELGDCTLLRLYDLDEALAKRDEVQNGTFRGTTHHVTDEADPGRGEAEWCECCGAHGTFDGVCELCQQDMERAEAAH